MKRWQSQTVFPIILLGLVAAMSFWLARTAEFPEARLDGKLRHDPDAIVENFQVRKLDFEGALQYRLTAPRMQHFPDDDSTLLSLPRLEYYRDRALSMTLTGRNGHVSAGGETVFLWEGVTATRAAAAGGTEMVARMPDLTVQPDLGTAFTDSPVELAQGRSWLRGVGMHLDDNHSTLALKSQVTGTYYRPKAPR